jgi:hypothetical protein
MIELLVITKIVSQFTIHEAINKFQFTDGCPEDWIKWLMAFREIENLMPMKEPADKTRTH